MPGELAAKGEYLRSVLTRTPGVERVTVQVRTLGRPWLSIRVATSDPAARALAERVLSQAPPGTVWMAAPSAVLFARAVGFLALGLDP